MSNKSIQQNYSKQGGLLKAARMRQELTQADVAFKLKLNKTQISAIERGVPNAWNGAYQRGYIQSYANLMDETINFTDDNLMSEKRINSKRSKLKDQSFVASQIGVSTLLIGATIILLSYVVWQVYSLTSAPTLILEKPQGSTILTEETSVRLQGDTDENVEVKINGISVLTDAEGGFSVVVPLNSGVNDFTIIATNKLSKQTTIEQTVVADYQIETSVE